MGNAISSLVCNILVSFDFRSQILSNNISLFLDGFFAIVCKELASISHYLTYAVVASTIPIVLSDCGPNVFVTYSCRSIEASIYSSRHLAIQTFTHLLDTDKRAVSFVLTFILLESFLKSVIRLCTATVASSNG